MSHLHPSFGLRVAGLRTAGGPADPAHAGGQEADVLAGVQQPLTADPARSTASVLSQVPVKNGMKAGSVAETPMSAVAALPASSAMTVWDWQYSSGRTESSSTSLASR